MEPAGADGGGESAAGQSASTTPQQPPTLHPPPSPLSGCYLLVVLSEPRTAQHKDLILNRLSKGFLSWSIDSCHVDLEKELQALVTQSPDGEEARNGERLIQYATENLVTEVLIHPQTNTLLQCIRNLLASFTKHRHIIHAGYTFGGNGSWILQDGTFSLSDFLDAFSEHEVQRVLRAYENSVTVDIHCANAGEWSTSRFSKEPCARACQVRVNPDDVLTAGVPAITAFANYIEQYLIPQTLDQLMEQSDVVGNIRFSHPTLYVFPGGQGDAALFGINGFNMLVDGGFARKACFWDFTRHLDRLDAVLVTRINNSNIGGITSVLKKKKETHVYPQIGHFFCNLVERKRLASPDGDKDMDPLIVDLIDIGQEMMANLRHISLKPHQCYRHPDPINLYHKVGHGTLDMYVLSPNKDSREVREFLTRWNASDSKLFASSHRKDSNNLTFPIQNMVSICALLVWQPANPESTITRILFPGSSPQHKVFEGFERLKHLEFLKRPVCSAKSLSRSMSLEIMKEKPLKQKLEVKRREKKEIPEMKQGKVIDDAISKTVPPTIAAVKVAKAEVKTKKPVEDKKIIDSKPKKVEKELKKEIKKVDKSEEETKKTELTKEEANKAVKVKAEIKKKEVKEAKETKVVVKKVEPRPQKESEPKPQPQKVEKKVEIRKPEKKDIVKSSPTTPKKTLNGAATKVEVSKTAPRAPPKVTKPSVAPPKSTKDATNRKVVEQKNIEIAEKSSAAAKEKVSTTATKPKPVERKLISRRPKPPSPSKTRGPPSPAKTIRHSPVKSEKKIKSEKEAKISTKEVAVKRKSLAEKSENLILMESKVLADLKEERDVVEEIEAVLQKAERNEERRKEDDAEADDEVTAEAIDKKGEDMTEEDITAEIEDAPKKEICRKESQELTEEDEYLIVEAEESMQSGDTEHKHHLDEAESEKVKVLEAEIEEDKEEKKDEIPEKEVDESEEPDIEEKKNEKAEEENVQLADVQPKLGEKKEAEKLKDKESLSPEKLDSSEKKSTDLDGKSEKEHVPEKMEESQEKVSTVESGGTTTAPTLPEDERIPLDEIAEDANEKHAIEDVKEKDLSPKAVDIAPEVVAPTSPKPDEKVFDVRRTTSGPQRDIVKTPDEVADLPVHEEVDPKFYTMDDYEKDKEEKRQATKDQKGVLGFFGKVADKFEKGIDKLTKKRRDSDKDFNDKSSKPGSPGESPKEKKKPESPTEMDMEKIFEKVHIKDQEASEEVQPMISEVKDAEINKDVLQVELTKVIPTESKADIESSKQAEEEDEKVQDMKDSGDDSEQVAALVEESMKKFQTVKDSLKDSLESLDDKDEPVKLSDLPPPKDIVEDTLTGVAEKLENLDIKEPGKIKFSEKDTIVEDIQEGNEEEEEGRGHILDIKEAVRDIGEVLVGTAGIELEEKPKNVEEIVKQVAKVLRDDDFLTHETLFPKKQEEDVKLEDIKPRTSNVMIPKKVGITEELPQQEEVGVMLEDQAAEAQKLEEIHEEPFVKQTEHKDDTAISPTTMEMCSNLLEFDICQTTEDDSATKDCRVDVLMSGEETVCKKVELQYAAEDIIEEPLISFKQNLSPTTAEIVMVSPGSTPTSPKFTSFAMDEVKTVLDQAADPSEAMEKLVLERKLKITREIIEYLSILKRVPTSRITRIIRMIIIKHKLLYSNIVENVEILRENESFDSKKRTDVEEYIIKEYVDKNKKITISIIDEITTLKSIPRWIVIETIEEIIGKRNLIRGNLLDISENEYMEKCLSKPADIQVRQEEPSPAASSSQKSPEQIEKEKFASGQDTIVDGFVKIASKETVEEFIEVERKFSKPVDDFEAVVEECKVDNKLAPSVSDTKIQDAKETEDDTSEVAEAYEKFVHETPENLKKRDSVEEQKKEQQKLDDVIAEPPETAEKYLVEDKEKSTEKSGYEKSEEKEEIAQKVDDHDEDKNKKIDDRRESVGKVVTSKPLEEARKHSIKEQVETIEERRQSIGKVVADEGVQQVRKQSVAEEAKKIEDRRQSVDKAETKEPVEQERKQSIVEEAKKIEDRWQSVDKTETKKSVEQERKQSIVEDAKKIEDRKESADKAETKEPVEKEHKQSIVEENKKIDDRRQSVDKAETKEPAEQERKQSIVEETKEIDERRQSIDKAETKEPVEKERKQSIVEETKKIDERRQSVGKAETKEPAEKERKQSIVEETKKIDDRRQSVDKAETKEPAEQERKQSVAEEAKKIEDRRQSVDKTETKKPVEQGRKQSVVEDVKKVDERRPSFDKPVTEAEQDRKQSIAEETKEIEERRESVDETVTQELVEQERKQSVVEETEKIDERRQSVGKAVTEELAEPVRKQSIKETDKNIEDKRESIGNIQGTAPVQQIGKEIITEKSGHSAEDIVAGKPGEQSRKQSIKEEIKETDDRRQSIGKLVADKPAEKAQEQIIEKEETKSDERRESVKTVMAGEISVQLRKQSISEEIKKIDEMEKSVETTQTGKPVEQERKQSIQKEEIKVAERKESVGEFVTDEVANQSRKQSVKEETQKIDESRQSVQKVVTDEVVEQPQKQSVAKKEDTIDQRKQSIGEVLTQEKAEIVLKQIPHGEVGEIDERKQSIDMTATGKEVEQARKPSIQDDIVKIDESKVVADKSGDHEMKHSIEEKDDTVEKTKQQVSEISTDKIVEKPRKESIQQEAEKIDKTKESVEEVSTDETVDQARKQSTTGEVKESDREKKATDETIDKSRKQSIREEETKSALEHKDSTVHKMFVTASSEDGGVETVICPTGSITFTKIVTPDDSQEISVKTAPEKDSHAEKECFLLDFSTPEKDVDNLVSEQKREKITPEKSPEKSINGTHDILETKDILDAKAVPEEKPTSMDKQILSPEKSEVEKQAKVEDTSKQSQSTAQVEILTKDVEEKSRSSSMTIDETADKIGKESRSPSLVTSKKDEPGEKSRSASIVSEKGDAKDDATKSRSASIISEKSEHKEESTEDKSHLVSPVTETKDDEKLDQKSPPAGTTSVKDEKLKGKDKVEPTSQTAEKEYIEKVKDSSKSPSPPQEKSDSACLISYELVTIGQSEVEKKMESSGVISPKLEEKSRSSSIIDGISDDKRTEEKSSVPSTIGHEEQAKIDTKPTSPIVSSDLVSITQDVKKGETSPKITADHFEQKTQSRSSSIIDDFAEDMKLSHEIQKPSSVTEHKVEGKEKFKILSVVDTKSSDGSKSPTIEEDIVDSKELLIHGSVRDTRSLSLISEKTEDKELSEKSKSPSITDEKCINKIMLIDDSVKSSRSPSGERASETDTIPVVFRTDDDAHHSEVKPSGSPTTSAMCHIEGKSRSASIMSEKDEQIGEKSRSASIVSHKSDAEVSEKPKTTDPEKSMAQPHSASTVGEKEARSRSMSIDVVKLPSKDLTTIEISKSRSSSIASIGKDDRLLRDLTDKLRSSSIISDIESIDRTKSPSSDSVKSDNDNQSDIKSIAQLTHDQDKKDKPKDDKSPTAAENDGKSARSSFSVDVKPSSQSPTKVKSQSIEGSDATDKSTTRSRSSSVASDGGKSLAPLTTDQKTPRADSPIDEKTPKDRSRSQSVFEAGEKTPQSRSRTASLHDEKLGVLEQVKMALEHPINSNIPEESIESPSSRRTSVSSIFEEDLSRVSVMKKIDIEKHINDEFISKGKKLTSKTIDDIAKLKSVSKYIVISVIEDIIVAQKLRRGTVYEPDAEHDAQSAKEKDSKRSSVGSIHDQTLEISKEHAEGQKTSPSLELDKSDHSDPHIDEEMTISEANRKEIETFLIDTYVSKSKIITESDMEEIVLKTSFPKYIIREIIGEIVIKKKISRDLIAENNIFHDTEDPIDKSLIHEYQDDGVASEFKVDSAPDKSDSPYVADYETPFHKAFVGGMTEIRTTHITTLSGKSTPDLSQPKEFGETTSEQKVEDSSSSGIAETTVILRTTQITQVSGDMDEKTQVAKMEKEKSEAETSGSKTVHEKETLTSTIETVLSDVPRSVSEDAGKVLVTTVKTTIGDSSKDGDVVKTQELTRRLSEVSGLSISGKSTPDIGKESHDSGSLERLAVSPVIRDLISEDRSYSGRSSPDVSLPKDIIYSESTGKSTPDIPMSPLAKDSVMTQSFISGRSTPDKKSEGAMSRTATPEGFRSGEVMRTIITTTRTMSEDGGIITTTKEVTETTNEKGETFVLAEKTDVKVDSDSEVGWSPQHQPSDVPVTEMQSDQSVKSETRETKTIESSSSSTVGESSKTTITESEDFSIKKFTVERELTRESKSDSAKYVDEADLDFEKVMKEKESSPDKSRGKQDPKDPKDSDKKDPLEGWGSPLGLPSPKPPKKFNLHSPMQHSASSSTDLTPDSLNFDAINDWGEPLRLPSPTPAANEVSNKASPGTPQKEKKAARKVISENIKNKKRSESPNKNDKKLKDSKNKMQPVYIDLTYVPHHGNSFYTALDFFKKVRARYYVFSGIEPSREVYDALLEAKKTWEDKDLEVTMIPTYDTDTLGYWVADNEEALAANHIDLSPSASRCTINLQDHETSCSAYRLEF